MDSSDRSQSLECGERVLSINGQKVCIQTFSGLAKARAHLRRFEALRHKQIYWLE